MTEVSNSNINGLWNVSSGCSGQHTVSARACSREPLLTAVGVNELGFREADPEVVEHRGLVEVAEGREVILPHEDVRVPERRQRSWINGIIQLLCTKTNVKLWK